MPYARRVDNNQKEIVKDLRKMGYSIEPDHDDILLGTQGRTFWYELKSAHATSKKTGQVRESSKQKSQKRLLLTYKGHYAIVSNLDELLANLKNELKG